MQRLQRKDCNDTRSSREITERTFPMTKGARDLKNAPFARAKVARANCSYKYHDDVHTTAHYNFLSLSFATKTKFTAISHGTKFYLDSNRHRPPWNLYYGRRNYGILLSRLGEGSTLSLHP